jgi:hypothetical protein
MQEGVGRVVGVLPEVNCEGLAMYSAEYLLLRFAEAQVFQLTYT